MMTTARPDVVPRQRLGASLLGGGSNVMGKPPLKKYVGATYKQHIECL